MENINYITVFTCTYPHEVLTPRAVLEANEIDVFVKDELTVGVNPMYSNAIGGIKIQVPEKEYQRALNILINSGFLKLEDLHKTNDVSNLDKLLNNHPRLIKILIACGIFLILAIGIIVSLLSKPEIEEILTRENWRILQVQYNDQTYFPHTNYPEGPLKIDYDVIVDYKSDIQFSRDGKVTIPGFNSSPIQGYWAIRDKHLVIYSVDTFQHVYNGTYEIIHSISQLSLLSDKTSIECVKR